MPGPRWSPRRIKSQVASRPATRPALTFFQLLLGSANAALPRQFGLASSTLQMNTLRAKGVMPFQAASRVVLAINASRRSVGTWCTTPAGTRRPFTG